MAIVDPSQFVVGLELAELVVAGKVGSRIEETRPPKVPVLRT